MSSEMSYRLTPELLLKVIEGEKNAIAGYESMKTMTNDKNHLEAFDRFIRDGQNHLRQFEEMHRRRFGAVPEPPRVPELFAHTLPDSIRYAAEDELASGELRRNIYLDNGGEHVRGPFFEAMTDSHAHAVRLNMMYAEELAKRMM